jgi:hypothetical protein
LISEFTGLFQRTAAAPRGRKTTITLAKAYCTPSRAALTGALKPLHIWFQAPMFDDVVVEMGVPSYQTAKITVKESQAEWAEYVILSIKGARGAPVFQVLSKPKNPKNAAWAARRSGVPMPWNFEAGDVSWIEHDCPEAKEMGKQQDGKTASLKNYGGVMFTKERRPASRGQGRGRSRRRSGRGRR